MYEPSADVKKAVARWYKTIANDHYKDRDCHFWIGEMSHVFYDGETGPVWAFYHNGYLEDEGFAYYDSPEECERQFVRWLTLATDSWLEGPDE